MDLTFQVSDGFPVFFIKRRMVAFGLYRTIGCSMPMTVKNKYPLPLIPDLITKLRGAKYFTKLDVRWGFNKRRMKEGNEWKAAFRTNCGLFDRLSCSLASPTASDFPKR